MIEYKTLQELFADPSRWTQNAYARTSNGIEIDPSSIIACSWCLLGGLNKIYPPYDNLGNANKLRFEIIKKIRDSLGHQAIDRWNDDEDRTIEDIQELCKELDI